MNHPSILLVENDVLVRHPLADYLRECGYAVLEALDAEEAQLLLRDSTLPIDIVFADIDAQKQEGFTLARWIRQHFPRIDVVLAGTVARACEKAGELCEDGPALAKPYDHQMILDQIRRLRAARDRGG